MNQSAPKVVIVGRTNVGKSTLFNRLVEDQKSLVSAIPGTTRDRFEADAIWRGEVVRMVDTGGLDVDKRDEIEQNIAMQAQKAIKEADLILFLVDVQAGPQPEDRKLAKALMKSNVPVIVVGNKADNETYRASVNGPKWKSWPMETPFPISAHRGISSGDLLDSMYEALKEAGTPPVEIAEITSTRVAVIGRPNVGKSTLLNSLVGEHRFITADREHTTREPNDTHISVDGKDYTLIDTAGIRKLARVNAGKSKLEKAGVKRSLIAAKRADVALFVIDVTKRIMVQDKFLAGELGDAGTSVVIVANKWDLIPDKDTNTIKKYEEYLRAHLPMLSYAPIVFTSAETGKRVQNLYEVIDKVYASRFTQLSRDEAREFIRRAIVKHKPSRGKGVAHPKIRYFEQGRVNPPTFYLGLKQMRKDVLNPSYLRFLKNVLRDQYDFEGTPIRIIVKAKRKSHTTM